MPHAGRPKCNRVSCPRRKPGNLRGIAFSGQLPICTFGDDIDETSRLPSCITSLIHYGQVFFQMVGYCFHQPVRVKFPTGLVSKAGSLSVYHRLAFRYFASPYCTSCDRGLEINETIKVGRHDDAWRHNQRCLERCRKGNETARSGGRTST